VILSDLFFSTLALKRLSSFSSNLCGAVVLRNSTSIAIHDCVKAMGDDHYSGAGGEVAVNHFLNISIFVIANPGSGAALRRAY
jgi:hypothetical protein